MKFLRRVFPTVLLLLLLASGAGFWMRHDEVLDWVAARGYEPSIAVKSMVSDTTMTPYAERLFYANRPEVDPKSAFNQHCTDPSDQVAVLGCFTGNRMGIYIYDVTDPRLAGIKQVTAAHEMLHQAYQRLNKADKAHVDSLLQQYYDQKASKKLKDKIDSYKASEPGELLNEMHSIFGTEASGLPPELEQYYKQYFTDRQKVLALHQKYQAEFDQRIAQINDYDAQLTALKGRIEASKVDVQAREQELRQRRAQLDAYLASNQISAYNAAVPGFNTLVASYKSLVNNTNSMIDKFNHMLAERNALAIQERQLENAIDSHVSTIPKQ